MKELICILFALLLLAGCAAAPAETTALSDADILAQRRQTVMDYMRSQLDFYWTCDEPMPYYRSRTGELEFTFEPGRVWKRDALGHSYPVGPQIVYEGTQAEERLLHELRNPMTVYIFAQEDVLLHIDGCGDEPWFTAQFACSGVTIEWDEYRRPAWYVKKRKE